MNQTKPLEGVTSLPTDVVWHWSVRKNRQRQMLGSRPKATMCVHQVSLEIDCQHCAKAAETMYDKL